ncbi:MAG: hypothetical protein WC725_04425 [Patescibacteria group bacterium]|jgi:hypothetical protein
MRKQNHNLPNLAVLFTIVAMALVVTGAGCNSTTTDIGANTTPTQTNTQLSEVNSPGTYKDGTYNITTTYNIPDEKALTEDVGVSVTLKNNIITDTSIQPKATNKVSQVWQNMFASNYKTQVIGQNINNLNLSVISGSSLTTNAFNDAIAKIKLQAK